ncbi:MAG: zinc-ribbon domain-containing protein [Bulleidia sp.]
MENRTMYCPACGKQLNDSYAFCPYCGTKPVKQSIPETQQEPQTSVKRQFVSDNGIPLASADVPQEYELKGSIVNSWKSDINPFDVRIQALSPDHSIVMASSSGEMYEAVLNPVDRQLTYSVPESKRPSIRDYMEPEAYIHAYARQSTGVQLTPVERLPLPGRFGKNLEQRKQELKAFYYAHAINLNNVRCEVSTVYCDSILIKYSAQIQGKQVIVLAGMDLKGVEHYDANDVINRSLGIFNMPLQSQQEPENPFDFFMQGGILGQMRRKNTPPQPQPEKAEGEIPFGHGREYGKRVDRIIWGSDRKYLLITPVEQESQATEIFLKFVGTIQQDPQLTQQENALIEQKFQQTVMQTQGLVMQAQQKQRETLAMQGDLSRRISQNARDISNGIMDSWNRRNDAQSRMSHNCSEAVRGVNSYMGMDGRTVEADVTADHVYQNRYGDAYGISGNDIDQNLADLLNWTKLNRK